MEIILFDGVCNLCNASVDFILCHDLAVRFHFAALQSEVGRTLDECIPLQIEPTYLERKTTLEARL